MKNLLNKLKTLNYKHYIAVGICLSMLLASIFLLPFAYVRIWETIVNLWNSIRYYFAELFKIDHNIPPTVLNKSSLKFMPVFNLPETWEEFVVCWNRFCEIFVQKQTVMAYFDAVGDILYKVCRVLALVVIPLVLVLWLLFRQYVTKQNNDYDKDSKALTFCKWLATKTYIPVKNWLKVFIEFCNQNKYLKIWFWFSLFAFNVLAIAVDFFAYYFYFVVTFDVETMYTQFYKLFCDLSYPLYYIPLVIWLVIAYVVMDIIRRKIGYKRLNHYEHRNCGFINERPIVAMVCGTMGKKKTTAITDMALSQEVMFRDKAFELILDCDLKFPYFPWINLEKSLQQQFATHKVFNLATARQYVRTIRFYSELEHKHKKYAKWIRRHLRKLNGYNFSNYLWGYDFDRYGTTYDNALQETNIWKVVEDYAQLYLVYTVQSSLIVANYSIRTDGILEDLGNFPLWNNDFFQKDTKLAQAYSRHAHILDFDFLRLGKKVLLENPLKDMFEFGVINVTEIGKERKNAIELQEIKKKEFLANQKNDGFNNYLKMCRHSATICNFPFIKFITDDQRSSCLGADARELCELVHIKETSSTKLAMPLFFVEELLYDFVFSKFTNLYYTYRFNRSDNTVPMYFLKKFVACINHYYTRTYNTFGLCRLDIQVESGTQDGIFTDKKYYLMFKKIYADRFSTDCFSDFFENKVLRSNIGIEDLPEYETSKATLDELEQQNSYFINELVESFYEDTNFK